MVTREGGEDGGEGGKGRMETEGGWGERGVNRVEDGEGGWEERGAK